MRKPSSTSVSVASASRRSAVSSTACLCAAGLLSVVTFSGCATTKAAAAIAGPPLAMSPPPPREIAPLEEEPLVATGNGLDTPLVTLPRVTQTPPTQGGRPRPPRVEAEPRGETTAAASAGTPGPSPPAEPPRGNELRPVPSADVPAIDHQRVQATLDRVEQQLGRLDPKKLNNDAQSNYAQARKFVSQARRNLNERNLGAAADAADKALKLAQDLTGR